jgi:hypothetical protein
MRLQKKKSGQNEVLDFLLGGAPCGWVGVFIININKKKGSFGILARWCGVFLCVCGFVCESVKEKDRERENKRDREAGRDGETERGERVL